MYFFFLLVQPIVPGTLLVIPPISKFPPLENLLKLYTSVHFFPNMTEGLGSGTSLL